MGVERPKREDIEAEARSMGLHMNEVLNDPKVDDYMVEALKSVPPSTQTRLLTFVDEILAEHNISKDAPDVDHPFSTIGPTGERCLPPAKIPPALPLLAGTQPPRERHPSAAILPAASERLGSGSQMLMGPGTERREVLGEGERGGGASFGEGLRRAWAKKKTVPVHGSGAAGRRQRAATVGAERASGAEPVGSTDTAAARDGRDAAAKRQSGADAVAPFLTR